MNASKIRNILVWVAQIFLFITLAWSAYMKIFRIEHLPFPWILSNQHLVKITAIFDLLGAVGILLPSILGSNKRIILWTAIGIILLMICAIVFHIIRGEYKDTLFNFVMIILSYVIVKYKNLSTKK